MRPIKSGCTGWGMRTVNTGSSARFRELSLCVLSTIIAVLAVLAIACGGEESAPTSAPLAAATVALTPTLVSGPTPAATAAPTTVSPLKQAATPTLTAVPTPTGTPTATPNPPPMTSTPIAVSTPSILPTPSTIPTSTPTSTPTPGGGSWIFAENEIIGDRVTKVIFSFASSGQTRFGDPYKLVIGCIGRDEYFWIDLYWLTFIGIDPYVEATYRIDSQEPRSVNWQLLPQGTNTYLVDESAKDFVLGLLEANQLAVSVTSSGESSLTAVFDLLGIGEAIEPVREACPF